MCHFFFFFLVSAMANNEEWNMDGERSSGEASPLAPSWIQLPTSQHQA